MSWLMPSLEWEDLINILKDYLQQDWKEIDPKYKETIIIQVMEYDEDTHV